MNTAFVVTSSLLNAVVVAFVVRRLLGVPAGWPRTVILSLGFGGASPHLFDWVAHVIELDTDPATDDGRVAFAIVVFLALAWFLAAEVGVLCMLEAVMPTGSLPHPFSFIATVPARVRRSRRYAEILRIAARHGLATYLRPAAPALERPNSATARSLRHALTEGGVTFVKLGQMLSTRADLLPAAYAAELEMLQSEVAPVPWHSVETVIEAELGRTVAEVFAYVDRTPLAAASVAQVHPARLADGTPVVLKVQRPDARRQVTADLDIILRLAAWLDRSTSWGRRLGVRQLARGFAASLEDELDYRTELANLQAVRGTLPVNGHVRAPHAIPELCTGRLLVMEQVQGRAVNRANDILTRFDSVERARLAEQLLRCVLRQILLAGVFHADLHPGNVYLAEDGHFTLLDFGSVGRLDRTTRASLTSLLTALNREDAAAATAALMEFLDQPTAVNHRQLERDVGQLLMRAQNVKTAETFRSLLRLVLDHRLGIPPPVAAAFRALGGLEGTLLHISPELDLTTAARNQGQHMLGERMKPAAVRDQLETQLAALLPVLQRLPRRMDRITDQLETGRLTIRISAFADPGDQAFITGLVQQVVTACLAAATALCGVVLIAADVGPQLTAQLRAYSLVGFTLLLFGFVLGARALAVAFRDQHRDRSRRPLR